MDHGNGLATGISLICLWLLLDERRRMMANLQDAMTALSNLGAQKDRAIAAATAKIAAAPVGADFQPVVDGINGVADSLGAFAASLENPPVASAPAGDGSAAGGDGTAAPGTTVGSADPAP